MTISEIKEYPYTGTITRVTEGERGSDVETTLYEGVMDETRNEGSNGSTLQTSGYIISIPLTKDYNGYYIIPCNGDKITLERYGQTIKFVVDDAEPSQLGGISIYVTRKEW